VRRLPAAWVRQSRSAASSTRPRSQPQIRHPCRSVWMCEPLLFTAEVMKDWRVSKTGSICARRGRSRHSDRTKAASADTPEPVNRRFIPVSSISEIRGAGLRIHVRLKGADQMTESPTRTEKQTTLLRSAVLATALLVAAGAGIVALRGSAAEV